MSATFKDLVRGVARVYRSRLFVLSLAIFSVRPWSFLQPESHLRWPSLGPSDSTMPWVSPEHDPTSLRHAEAGLSKSETPLGFSQNSPHGLMASRPFSPSADSWEKNRKRLGWTPDTWGWYGTWAVTHIPSRPTEVASASLETLPNSLELEWSWNSPAPPPHLSPSFSLPLARHSQRLGPFPQRVGPVSPCDNVVSAWHDSGGLRGLHHVLPSLRSHANLVTEGCGSRLKGMAFGRKRQKCSGWGRWGVLKDPPQNISYTPQCAHLILTVI